MPSSEVFDKFKAGTLMSGGGDKPVRDRNEEVAQCDQTQRPYRISF
jgi:hypothetical protein